MLLVLPLNVQGAEECGLQYDPSAQHDAWHAEQGKAASRLRLSHAMHVPHSYLSCCTHPRRASVPSAGVSQRWGPARMLEICMGQWSPYCMFTSGGRACLTRCCPPLKLFTFLGLLSECG